MYWELSSSKLVLFASLCKARSQSTPLHLAMQSPCCTCVPGQALSTNIASDGMESARRACGGHGYSLLSGLPTTFTHYVQNVTWEGDNNVMLLQVGPAVSVQVLGLVRLDDGKECHSRRGWLGGDAHDRSCVELLQGGAKNRMVE